jgi:membrane protease YdiL (CAAX protease family)
LKINGGHNGDYSLLLSFSARGTLLFLVAFFIRAVSEGLTIKGIHMINPALTVQKDLGWLVMVIYALVAYLAVKWVRIDKEIGLTVPFSAKEWYTWLPVLLLVLPLVLHLGFHSIWIHVPFPMIAAFGVAVNEEILFRGILLRGFLRFGRLIAIIVPFLLFGASHLGNILVGGDVTYGLFQFVWTLIAGMAISALRLQCKSLLPAIAFHILLDDTEYAVTGEFGVHSLHLSTFWLTVNVLFNFALLVYAIITLMKTKTTVTLGAVPKEL